MLASWTLRHVPASTLASSPLFMEPFIFRLEASVPTSALELLTNLWVLQIQCNPNDLRIAKNAKHFRSHISGTPILAKRISTALRNTRLKGLPSAK